jgi:hypothetical protein
MKQVDTPRILKS